ncbi:uncharacterized protein MONOS_15445 [Monocercomonoides exilis]|uniref:uncharacterized protein n=1 Tax=Monocercomonoides exilis TaxID=2049356 RepID=UPI003559C672|nr:hypothetical protein MONOS_15445 [Monocercomonoides exilis]|eukprot:MONOS_15445.1-p1 / transcript=MONOS_15445.1 / gene=MONOS_15445 / organism=Monocercomonoides_exilis_PA203 / gene_product=unspecified product / transcript_product=unspecified product / location=Mono_scaffold01233:11260-11505(-) / protein_length=82 / sequence_SO=supercontig / SO=protein_coding / is_pseudo=false
MLLMHDKTLTPLPLPRSAVPLACETAPHAARSPAAPPKQIGRPTSFALQLPPRAAPASSPSGTAPTADCTSINTSIQPCPR